MNQRIQKLRDRLYVEKYPLSIEKIRLVTETFRQTEGEPQILRRAKALANVYRDSVLARCEDVELKLDDRERHLVGTWIAGGLNG